RRKRYGITITVTDTEKPDVFSPRAEFALGLDVHLPYAAEPVEVIDEEATHERLQRLINQIDVNTLVQDLVAIYLRINLRRVRDECRSQRGKLGPLPCSLEEAIRVLREKIDCLAGAVFQHERHAAGGSDPWNRRRCKSKGLRIRKPGKPLVQLLDDRSCSQS